MTHYVHVPLRMRDEVLQIPVKDLPEDSRRMIRILQDEKVGLDVWLEMAVSIRIKKRFYCIALLIYYFRLVIIIVEEVHHLLIF